VIVYDQEPRSTPRTSPHVGGRRPSSMPWPKALRAGPRGRSSPSTHRRPRPRRGTSRRRSGHRGRSRARTTPLPHGGHLSRRRPPLSELEPFLPPQVASHRGTMDCRNSLDFIQPHAPARRRSCSRISSPRTARPRLGLSRAVRYSSDSPRAAARPPLVFRARRYLRQPTGGGRECRLPGSGGSCVRLRGHAARPAGRGVAPSGTTVAMSPPCSENSTLKTRSWSATSMGCRPSCWISGAPGSGAGRRHRSLDGGRRLSDGSCRGVD